MTQEEGKAGVTIQDSKMDASMSDQSNKFKADKREKQSLPTKVVIRRLPPSMNQDTFMDQIAPVPDNDYLYFVRADMSLGQFAFARAYINFVHHQDVFLFKDKFDGYVFVDGKGNEYPAVVEFAPFQKVPKKKAKKDSKSGTVEQDPDYIKFVETWNKPEEISLPSAEFYLEEIENREREMRANNGDSQNTTPLIEYLRQRRAEKQRIREEKREERRRRDLEKKRIKEEERRRRKLEKDKERERMKDKSGKEADGDKSSSGYKTSKDGPVKLLKNPDREKEKAKENENAEFKEGSSRDNVDVRHKVRVASGDKYSRGASYHGVEGESDRRPQYDSKSKNKDKFKDRKERDRYGRKGNETVGHSSRSGGEFKKDVEDRDVIKKPSSDQTQSSAKKMGSRGGKSYERTRESVARSRESRVTFDCSEDRAADSNKTEPKPSASKNETKPTDVDVEKIKCEADVLEIEQHAEETARQEEDNPNPPKKSSRSSQETKSERRIRNKDRPSMEIYRPGMRRFSLQRNSPQKDSPSSSSSPSPTSQLTGKPDNSERENAGDSPPDSYQNSPTDEPLPAEEPIIDGNQEEDATTGIEMLSEIASADVQ